MYNTPQIPHKKGNVICEGEFFTLDTKQYYLFKVNRDISAVLKTIFSNIDTNTHLNYKKLVSDDMKIDVQLSVREVKYTTNNKCDLLPLLDIKYSPSKQYIRFDETDLKIDNIWTDDNNSDIYEASDTYIAKQNDKVINNNPFFFMSTTFDGYGLTKLQTYAGCYITMLNTVGEVREPNLVATFPEKLGYSSVSHIIARDLYTLREGLNVMGIKNIEYNNDNGYLITMGSIEIGGDIAMCVNDGAMKRKIIGRSAMIPGSRGEGRKTYGGQVCVYIY